MNLLEAALRRITRDLDAAGCKWAIVGGLAVSARAEPRTTRDVDVAVSVTTDAEAEALVRLLQAGRYRVQTVIEHEARKRLAAARLALPEPEDVLVDLLFASSGIETEIAIEAQLLDLLPDLTAPVATLGHLLALKILARDDRTRPQDSDDIRALLREAHPSDLESTRLALQLIEQRGFHRGRRLVQQLDEIVASHSLSKR